MTLKTQFLKPGKEKGSLSGAREGNGRRNNRGNEKNGDEERQIQKGMEEG